MSTADGEELHNFDDIDTSVTGDTHGGRTHTNSNSSPTARNNAKNTKETEPTDENFNSFHYWRSPLPDISGELEMLTGQTSEVAEKEEQRKMEMEDIEECCPETMTSHGKATSDQIQKVLDCLQPHIDDPDVQGEYRDLGLFRLVFDTELL